MFRLADLVRTMFVHTVPPASHVGLHYDVESNHDAVVVEISGPFNPKDTIMRHIYDVTESQLLFHEQYQMKNRR